MDALVILPAYNEKNHIHDVLSQLQSRIDDVIIIDDCSNDSTLNIVQELGFKYLKNQRNYGLAFCIKKGIRYALDNGCSGILNL